MLRPHKGEGERSQHNKKKRKAPQIILTALIFATPLCLAESALASTSSFGLLSGQQPQSALQQTGLLHPAGNLLGQNLQTKFASSAPIISEADISALETRLSQYKATLATLKGKSPKNPTLQAQIDTQIATVSEQISDLESLISKAKRDLADYTKAQETLAKALERYNEAQNATKTISEKVSTYEQEYQSHTEAYTKATESYDASLTILNGVKQELQAAEDALSSADASLTTQIEITNNALTALNTAKATTAQAEADLSEASKESVRARNALKTATTNKEQVQQDYDNAQINLSNATSALEQARQVLNTALSNYNNNLIPDPTWTVPTQQVAHTRLVPHTTTRIDTQTIPNILFNSALTNTEGWSGVYAGWQGSNPALIDGQVTFSYQTQSVSQGLFSGPFQNATLTLSADWSNNDLNRGFVDTYSMTVEARDINQNLVGTATYNSTGSHAWENKSVTLQATGPVSYITVTFTGIDAGYWYGTYGPSFKNPVLSITHGQEITETTYTEETYYTTEPVLTQGTIQVQINEGGQATFTAPEGATFTGSNLRYEAKDRPECGANISPQVNGLNQVTIQASNGVWGDPCGGWYKHIVGTLSYLGQPTAPLIHNPALLPALTQAQEAYDSALSTKNSAELTYDEKSSELVSAITSYDLAVSNKAEASDNETIKTDVYNAAVLEEASKQTAYDAELLKRSNLETSKASAGNSVSTAKQAVTTAEADVATKTQEVATAQTVKEASFQTLSTEQANLTAASSSESVALASKSEAEDLVVTKQTIASTSLATASTKAEVISFTEVETALETPPDEGSKELPADLSADNLMSVDLTKVDPTEMTEAQAEQLKEAALETFLTAEVGSPEYEQALDALYLAAEQDDIVLDESLAAIPGLAGAVELINFFGNAGADMSPKVREESKKVVVAGVVAVGAAVASATGAATSAASSSSSGSGSGSSTRRKQ